MFTKANYSFSLSWDLWAKAHKPSEYSLRPSSRRYESSAIKLGIGIFPFIAMFLMLGMFASIAIPQLWQIFFLLLFAFNSFSCLYFAINITQAITTEKERNRYDLLMILPPGPLNANWQIATDFLQSSLLFRVFQFLARSIASALMFVLAIAAFVTLLLTSEENKDTAGFMANLNLMPTMVIGIALTVGFYIDFIQSFVMSKVIAMLTAHRTQYSATAKLISGSFFLIAQLGIYITSWLICTSLLPAFLVENPANLDVRSAIQLGVGIVLTVYLTREFIIRLLWFVYQKMV